MKTLDFWAFYCELFLPFATDLYFLSFPCFFRVFFTIILFQFHFSLNISKNSAILFLLSAYINLSKLFMEVVLCQIQIHYIGTIVSTLV